MKSDPLNTMQAVADQLAKVKKEAADAERARLIEEVILPLMSGASDIYFAGPGRVLEVPEPIEEFTIPAGLFLKLKEAMQPAREEMAK